MIANNAECGIEQQLKNAIEINCHLERENNILRDIIADNLQQCSRKIVNRFTVSQFLAELADGHTVSMIAGNYELDEQILKDFLYTLADVLKSGSEILPECKHYLGSRWFDTIT
jgi:hypothetical protein